MGSLLRSVILLVAALNVLSCHASLIDDIISALQNAVDCASCHAIALPALQVLAKLGNDPFVTVLTDICELTKAEDTDVCVGELSRSGPILAHALRKFEPFGTTATKFCEATLGLCQQPPVTPFNVPFPKPMPALTSTPPTTRRPPFKVVHLSDVHIDRNYTVGSDSNCTKPICCRNYADHVGPITEPAELFGNHKCDSPPDLAQSLLSAIQEFGSDAAFAIFTGDVVEGTWDTWLVNSSNTAADLQEWNSQMLESIGLTVYPAVGNDATPVNSFPRNTTVTTIGDAQFVFDVQSLGWEQWIGGVAAQEVHDISGSYGAVVPGTQLRIISMNTQYWYKQNFWLYDQNNQVPDPNGLLAFLVSQLQAAEDAGQRAWIIGHIPSGKSDFPHDQSNYYDQIVQRYKNTIAAQFFGHSHKDEFEIAYSDWNNQTADTADSIEFIGPALTPTSGNPAFKLYDVDPDTFEVMDMKVYFTNVSDPTFHESPTWQLYYSARESYGPLVDPILGPEDALNASFWHRLTEVFEQNGTAFQLWNTRLSRGGAVSSCTGDCIQTAICDMRAARSENNCDVTSPGIGLRRAVQEDHAKQQDSDCEGGRLRRILAHVMASRDTLSE
ncbi:sphingomyelin phosphodiesterase [Irpex rosettiformis]|uniref:Sphingomyelin phosphodiesterase n=1 Tax=Irpex rosettiformis TaxID=378272 RepID=A0ACB8TN76_9APHY|nr:sphingomyelin phosphodiesterase [Irpex rosettiformis]